jgi:hypothetical protein
MELPVFWSKTMTNITTHTSTSISSESKAISVLSNEATNYVNRYRSFAKATAESIIGLAMTVVEAQSKLDSINFALFLDVVGLKKDGSTYQKMMTIGKNASRFEPMIDRLPSAWTTIYTLAKLEPNEFVTVANSNVLNPLVTAKEISSVLSKKSDVKSQSFKPDFALDVSNLNTAAKDELYSALVELRKKIPFVFTMTSEVEKEVTDYKRNLAA